MATTKREIATLIQNIKDRNVHALTPELKFEILEKLEGFEDLFYELEKWKKNYQALEREFHQKDLKCTKYHIHDNTNKHRMIQLVQEGTCGKCSVKLQSDIYTERYKNDKFVCDICLKVCNSSQGIHFCNDCKFDVCQSCIEDVNLPDFISCPKCKSDLELLHCLGDPYKNGEYFCDGCTLKREDVSGVYHCEKCNSDFCMSCSQNLKKKIVFLSKRESPHKPSPQKSSAIKSQVKNEKNENDSIDYVIKFEQSNLEEKEIFPQRMSANKPQTLASSIKVNQKRIEEDNIPISQSFFSNKP